MTTTIDYLKSEISDGYIKDFKKEIGWLKSIVLLPIKKPIKDILMGKTQLPEKFDEVIEFGRWRKVMNFATPQMANQLFEFMKKKRLEIESKKTESELINLRNEVLGLTSEGSSISGKEEDELTGLNENADAETVENSAEETSENGVSELEENSSEDFVIDNKKDEGDGGDVDDGDEKDGGVTPIKAGVTEAVVGGAAVRGLSSISSSIDLLRMSKEIDAETIKSSLGSTIEAVKRQQKALKDAQRLSTKVDKNITKYITNMENGLNSFNDDGVALLKERNALGGKLPNSLLKDAGLSVNQLDKLEKIIADENIANSIIGKNLDDADELLKVKTLLKSNGIDNIDDSIIKNLSKAADVNELKSMTKVLKHGSKINRIMQTMCSALLVDVVFTGLDVRMYFEQNKEADMISKVNEIRAKNKRNQASFQLWNGIASVAIEGALIILAECSAAGSTGGPVGALIGVGVGLLTAATSIGADYLYYEVKDFYLQNKEDFLRQKRSKLKQAILQCINNKKEGNISLNEKIASLGLDGKDKEQSLGDALFSILFLDEIEESADGNYNSLLEYIQSGKNKEDYLSNLQSEEEKNNFNKKYEEVENIVNERMKYLKNELNKNEIIVSMRNGMGMQYLTNMIRKSKGYVEMKQHNYWKDEKTYEENMDLYKSEFFSDFSKEKLMKLESLKQNNESLFYEIIYTTDSSKFLDGDENSEDENEKNYEQNVKLVEKYKDRLKINNDAESKGGDFNISDTYQGCVFIERLLYKDFDLKQVEYPTLNEDNVITIINSGVERRGDLNISDDIFQNVIYRLAKELYGFGGKNNMEELMNFFDPADDATHGLYYNGKCRKANIDWSIDKKLKDNIPDKISKSQVNQYVEKFINENNFLGENIDTATESIDSHLNKELHDKIKQILTEELMNYTIENKNKVKSEIENFIKSNSKGNYLELPYYLLLEAKKAGLGDLQRQYYRCKDDKIEICYMESEINTEPLFENCNESCVNKTRSEYTEAEQCYIDRVEKAYKLLQNQIKECHNTDYGLFVGEKYKEWCKLKDDVLCYNQNKASGIDVLSKYKDFAEYFEGLYRGYMIGGLSDSCSDNLYYGQVNLFDDKGMLIDSQLDTLKFGLIDNIQPTFVKEYERLIKEIKLSISDQEKSIEDLRAGNYKEKELAKRASNWIVIRLFSRAHSAHYGGDFKSLLSNGTRKEIELKDGIGTSSKGTIKTINEYPNSITQELEEEFKNNKLRTIPPDIDSEEILKLQHEQQIVQLKSVEKTLTHTSGENQSKIEKACKDSLNWQHNRGDIKYDIDTGKLKSWGNETLILEKGNKIKLDKFPDQDVCLTVDEGIRLANFRNRVKFKYPDKTIKFGVDIFNRKLTRRKTLLADGTMLLGRSDLEKYSPSCKDDAFIENLCKWLNM